MDSKHVTQVYFSPGGTTRQVTERVASQFAEGGKAVDLLKGRPKEPLTFGKEDLVIVGMPVFSGRIPPVCPAMLELLRGDGTPAVALAVYGNREYEDALLELCGLLEKNGFAVIGAGAFVARHSIFPAVAAGRPDESDQALIQRLAHGCKEKLAAGPQAYPLKIAVKGNRPYRDISPVPLKPAGNADCNGCGSCARICPVGAIPADNPQKTDGKRCITCTACIYQCPQKARGFHGLAYKGAELAFRKKCSARKEPELFL